MRDKLEIPVFNEDRRGNSPNPEVTVTLNLLLTTMQATTFVKQLVGADDANFTPRIKTTRHSMPHCGKATNAFEGANGHKLSA